MRIAGRLVTLCVTTLVCVACQSDHAVRAEGLSPTSATSSASNHVEGSGDAEASAESSDEATVERVEAIGAQALSEPTPNTAQPDVDASTDALFAGPDAALPVHLLAHIPDAPYLAVVDVTGVRARWANSGFAAFALHADIDPVLQRLANEAGARLVDPAAVTALAASYDPVTQALILAVTGGNLENVGETVITQEGPVSTARPQGSGGGAPATVALGRGLPTSAIAVLRGAPDDALPELLATGFRIGWASDDTLWVDVDADASADQWIGRGQAFASQTLGQLRTSAPPELQAGVTLLTRWQEALWARLRLQSGEGYTRLGLPAPRCGGVSRNALAGALLLGWMDAASNDESLALRPRVPMSAQLQAGCDAQQTSAELPRHLARLGDGQVAGGGGAQVALGDASALLRTVAPSAGGLLPFALPRDVVIASLGARPLGVDSLDDAAPMALVSHGASRAMVLPVGTANALGPNTLLEGGVPQLLDGDGVLISRAGSGFALRLEASDSRWRDAAQLLPANAALALLWAPAEAWHGTEVLGIAWIPGDGLVLGGAPASEPWSAETLSERVVALARGGLPGGILAEDQQARLRRAMGSVQVQNVNEGWRAEGDEIGPWIPVAIELGLAAWGGSIERGPIQFPVAGPLSPGLQFTEPPPTNARP